MVDRNPAILPGLMLRSERVARASRSMAKAKIPPLGPSFETHARWRARAPQDEGGAGCKGFNRNAQPAMCKVLKIVH
jgi:hypothetical protein